MENARKAYEEVVSEWNDALISWRVRLVKNLGKGTLIQQEIDQRIVVPFVSIGNTMEHCIRRSVGEDKSSTHFSSKMEKDSVDRKLNEISKAIFEVGREIYAELAHLSTDRLDHERLTRILLDSGKIDELSIAQLLRAVFKSSNGGHI